MAAGLGAQSQAAQPQVRHADIPELEELEPRRREQPAQLRAERRYTLNTLMVGAPLTAAFVGLMAADDAAALDDAQGAGVAGSGAGVRSGGDRAEPGHSVVAAQPPEGVATGSPGPLLDRDGAPRTEISGAAEPTSTAGGSGSGTEIETTPVQIPAQRTSADSGTEGFGVTGPMISLSFFGVQAFEGGEQQVVEPIPPERGPIGIFTPGTAGDDLIIGTEDDDNLRGGAGDDEIRGLGGDDVLDGGAGNDRLFGDAGDDELTGGEGDDELHGGAGDDDLLAGVGDDQLFGGDGRDRLIGDFGDDLLDGGPGADRMEGGPGDDILVVDDINDVPLERAIGPDGGGNDTLRVEEGFADSLLEFAGASNAAFRFGIDTPLPTGVDGSPRLVDPDIENIVLEGTADHDVIGDARDNVIRGNGGDNTLHGGGGDDILRGGGGADRLNGGAGNDRLHGGTDDDILAGAAGDDELFGEAGDDILRGGTGEDRLFGGAGDDTYVIGLNEADATDAIFDHEGVNHIRLEGAEGHLVQTALIGDQLRIIVDNNETPVAVVDDYRGHEDAFSGIDLGDGIVPVSSLLVSDVPAEPDDSPDPEPKDDVLDDFLPGPTLGNAGNGVVQGTSGADELFGTSGDDWLRGNAADDLLEGGAGNDVLEGGPGQNTLVGGPGNDLYLFRSGELDAVSTIRDSDGTNVAELEGFSSLGQMRAVEVDGNLIVVGDFAPMLEVENFVGNEGAFAGVWVGEEFVGTEQLVQGWQPS